jgi:hypothetical protein
VFSAFRRVAERPEYRIVKDPALLGKVCAVLKRGNELAPVLAPVERKLVRLVEG